jgi:hypothetical protein
MPHVVLLGDSIFDNAAYVPGEPAVVEQLRGHLPPAWSATLLAVDGARVLDVSAQVARLPRDASHLVLSAGGNDALSFLPLLDQEAASVAEVLDELADMAEWFAGVYDRLLAELLDLRLPLAVCTIYNGALGDLPLQRRARTALAHFNDVILSNAARHDLPVVELRALCTEAEDYANPIEPSAVGGDKIARAITALLVARQAG